MADEGGPTAPATVVEVVAPWCASCRAMRHDLAEVAASYAGSIDVLVVDAAESPEEAERLAVRGTPTLLGYRGNAEVFRVVGRRTRAELDALFGSLTTAEAAPAAGIGARERRLRVAAGAVIGGVGLALGPAWPLVGVGAGVVALGLATGR